MNESETCIVMIRGAKFTNMVKDIEENLMKHFSKIKVVSLNGAKYRLSFEKGYQSQVIAIVIYYRFCPSP